MMVDFRPHENLDVGFDFKNFAMADQSQFHVHEKWDQEHIYDANDIAIIEFPEGVDFGIDPVLLASDYVEYENDPGVAVGYGRMYWNCKCLFCCRTIL